MGVRPLLRLQLYRTGSFFLIFLRAAGEHERAPLLGVKEGVCQGAHCTRPGPGSPSGLEVCAGPECTPAAEHRAEQRPPGRHGHAEVLCARRRAGAAAGRPAGARGASARQRPRGSRAALRGDRRARVPLFLPLPWRSAGLQSPEAGAPSRAAAALGRSAVSILPGPRGNGLPARDSGKSEGLAAEGLAARSFLRGISPGLNHQGLSVEVERALVSLPRALRAA